MMKQFGTQTTMIIPTNFQPGQAILYNQMRNGMVTRYAGHVLRVNAKSVTVRIRTLGGPLRTRCVAAKNLILYTHLKGHRR